MSLSTPLPSTPTKTIIYPDSDGQPMADNTKQYEWIEKIKGGCESLLSDDPDVFVAGDLLWYPVEGHPEIRIAPDVLVAFGRPKGHRGSYKQWEENGIAPQVVFEILSPGNRFLEMLRKLQVYEQYGVQEYYIYDPDRLDFSVFLRENDRLTGREFTGTFTSPRLGIRFEKATDAELTIFRPDGRPFLTFAETERERVVAEEQRQIAEQQANRLANRLRELGIDPDSLESPT